MVDAARAVTLRERPFVMNWLLHPPDVPAAAGKRKRCLRKRAALVAAVELGYVLGPDALGTPPAGRLREALLNTRWRA